MTPKQTSFAYALAKIQQLQDMYSKYFQVSITIYNVDNQPVTIPSNQIPFCNSKLTDTDSVCQVFAKRLTPVSYTHLSPPGWKTESTPCFPSK